MMSEKEFKEKVINYVKEGYYAKAQTLLFDKVQDAILAQLIEKERID